MSQKQDDEARFNRQAGGVVELYMIETRNAARLNARALAGDPTAGNIMRAIGAWAARVFTQLPEKPRCLACDVMFQHDGEPAALACTLPLERDSAWVTIAGMCAACAASGATGKAVAAWNRQWPGSVVVPTVT